MSRMAGTKKTDIPLDACSAVFRSKNTGVSFLERETSERTFSVSGYTGSESGHDGTVCVRETCNSAQQRSCEKGSRMSCDVQPVDRYVQTVRLGSCLFYRSAVRPEHISVFEKFD